MGPNLDVYAASVTGRTSVKFANFRTVAIIRRIFQPLTSILGPENGLLRGQEYQELIAASFPGGAWCPQIMCRQLPAQ